MSLQAVDLRFGYRARGADRAAIRPTIDAVTLAIPPDFVRRKTNDGYLLRSGAGGTPVSISSINGDVVVRRK